MVPDTVCASRSVPKESKATAKKNATAAILVRKDPGITTPALAEPTRTGPESWADTNAKKCPSKEIRMRARGFEFLELRRVVQKQSAGFSSETRRSQAVLRSQ